MVGGEETTVRWGRGRGWSSRCPGPPALQPRQLGLGSSLPGDTRSRNRGSDPLPRRTRASPSPHVLSLPLSRWESRKRNRLNREWQLRTFPDRPFQTPLRLLRKRRCRHHPNPRQLGWGCGKSGAKRPGSSRDRAAPRPHSRPAGQGPQRHDHEQEGTSTAGRGLASSAHSVTAAPHRAAGGAGAGGAAVRTPGQAPAAPASPPQQPRGPVPSGSSTAFL